MSITFSFSHGVISIRGLNGSFLRDIDFGHLPAFIPSMRSLNIIKHVKFRLERLEQKFAMVIPLGEISSRSSPIQKTPFLKTISCIMIPKEYTSPLGVPSGGGSSALNISGDVHSFSKNRQNFVKTKKFQQTAGVNEGKRLTFPIRIRFIVFEFCWGCSEIVQSEIGDFQNESAVDDTIRRFERSMRSYIGAVKECHSLNFFI